MSTCKVKYYQEEAHHTFSTDFAENTCSWNVRNSLEFLNFDSIADCIVSIITSWFKRLTCKCNRNPWGIKTSKQWEYMFSEIWIFKFSILLILNVPLSLLGVYSHQHAQLAIWLTCRWRVLMPWAMLQYKRSQLPSSEHRIPPVYLK